jgi:lytic murein transglycosylase
LPERRRGFILAPNLKSGGARVRITRRTAAFGLVATGLAACGARVPAPALVTSAVAAAEPPAQAEPAPPARPDSGYDRWVGDFRMRVSSKGISETTLNAAFRDAGYLPSVIENDRKQFQDRRTLEDYIAIAATDARLSTGAKMTAQHKRLLADIERQFGVEAEVLLAIWGMESSYGARRGSTPVVSALSTLGYASRRAAFFEGQLVAALRILQRGDIAPAKMTGSWAGAMGHTQFIPTTFESHAVDFRGDGRRDIWADDPTDALASAANYLRASGWNRGQLWGLEVRLPQGGAALETLPVAEWSAKGVRRADGRALPDHGPAQLILPGGAGGPAFLLFRNYWVFRKYNDSMKYALAVGHLSDRLAGGKALVGSFGADAEGLTLDERKEMQERLTRAGFDTDGADGVIGDKTTTAIRAYEAARGLAVTGIASQALLRHLRG